MLSLFTDVLLVIPIFPLIIVIAAYLRSAGLADHHHRARRSSAGLYGARQLRVAGALAAQPGLPGGGRVRGERRLYIIVVEIMPTMTSLIVASFLGQPSYAVLTAAGLQFIGLGDPNAQSWGTMLYWAQNNEALRCRRCRCGRSCPASASPCSEPLRAPELRLRRDLQPGAAAGAQAGEGRPGRFGHSGKVAQCPTCQPAQAGG